MELIEKTAPLIQAKGVASDTHIAKVSVVGVGVRTHAGVAAKMFKALAEQSINIEMISTSEIKVSVVVAEKDSRRAVDSLHASLIEGR
jgi:aspartate kinase